MSAKWGNFDLSWYLLTRSKGFGIARAFQEPRSLDRPSSGVTHFFLPIHRASKYNDKWRSGGWATVEKSEPSKFRWLTKYSYYSVLTILLEGRIAYPVQDYHNECKRSATHALKLTSSYRPIFFAPRRLRPSQSTPAVIPLPQLVTTGLSPEIIFSAYCAPTTLSSAARSSCSGRKVVYSPSGVP